MKDYSKSLNQANMAPNGARNEFRGPRPAKPAYSAGEDKDPGHSPTSPQKPAVSFNEGTNRPPRAMAVVELNDND